MSEVHKKTTGETFHEICDKAWEIRDQIIDDTGKFDIPTIRYNLKLNRTDAQMVGKYLTQKMLKISS